MLYSKLASAIYNDIVSGLSGYTSVPNISMEQLEDDIVDERLKVIQEIMVSGKLQKEDLLLTIPCIKTNCDSIDKCNKCINDNTANKFPTLHFEIPQFILIDYIGSTDKQNPFIVYTNLYEWNYHKYRKRFHNKPVVFVDSTPNSNNFCDCWVFNAPLLREVTVIGIFKDVKQLEFYGCCPDEEIRNFTYIDNEVKKRLTQKKLMFYRQYFKHVEPNDQAPK